MLKQLSIFVENEVGVLSKVTGILLEGGVNLRAIASLDTPEFGILRMVVDKPDEAAKLLQENHYVVKVTEVIALELEDRPGSLDEVFKLVADANLQINYIYSLVLRDGKAPLIILHMDDMKKALEVLSANGVKIYEDALVY